MYTSNFARLRYVNPPLRPVSIARGTPRWFRGPCYEALAPEWEWLRFSREEYDRAFRRRLNQLDPRRVYEDLGEQAVLLCWCKHNAGCHRRLVAERNPLLTRPGTGFCRVPVSGLKAAIGRLLFFLKTSFSKTLSIPGEGGL